MCRYGETLLHLESVALKSIQDFIQIIQNHDDQAFDPEEAIHVLTTDIMSQLVSESFLPEDDSVSELLVQQRFEVFFLF